MYKLVFQRCERSTSARTMTEACIIGYNSQDKKKTGLFVRAVWVDESEEKDGGESAENE